MGSTGSGRFSDYSGRAMSESDSGGSSGRNPCDQAFEAILEEVERSSYFVKNGCPPAEGTVLNVTFQQRPAVATDHDEVVGYLPTKFNYIRACLAEGHTYSAVVTSSHSVPIVSVTVDVAPN